MIKGLTTDEVLHIAELVNITLNDEEITRFKNQLAETVSYVNNLKELDTSNTEPTSHSTKSENVFFEDGSLNMRKLSSTSAVSQAKKSKNNLFVVERIMG